MDLNDCDGMGDAGRRRKMAGADGPAILFLDVDGVLNDRAFVARHRWGATYGMVDRTKVRMLNAVARLSGCLVVVTSTWRSDACFRASLRGRGARVRYHRDWRTKVCDPEARITGDGDDREARGREIAEWLSRNRVGRYAIVDDGDDVLPDQRSRLVRTTYDAGLGPGHVQELVALLTGE